MEHNSISEAAFEFTVEKMNQTIKRMLIIIIMLIIAVIATNVGWIIYESQYESYTYTLDAGECGNANYIGSEGNINNGTYNSQEEN
jgi:hypothetical protein